ncbi:cyclin-dependent kinase G-2-like isoform X3 [Cynara cardunculus var. scolymus]|uniref:cyclin-dependent kinase G-2-like isoform X3 n=1 Tax=Cynara cardunculus var. scolymus TaxID=59895 RepID=UPI000D62DEB7|nr:cyclin-dependent kinase G-2-like isoform X3 [Cynara cardunculus var. scolymus]
MNKYMAAGRHGGYRDNEFRERESDLDVSKREFSYSKGEYDRVRNGGNGAYERGKNRARDSRGGGRLRQKDIKERELVNGGGYRSASSRSYSGGSGEGGDSRHGDYHLRVGDREPGELSSESGSDEAVDSEIHGKSNEGSKMDNSSQSSLYSKKRKFSPIVWDRDDKEAGNSSMTRSSPANTTLPPPPPVPKSHRRSPNFVPAAVVQNFPVESNKLHSAHQSPGDNRIQQRTGSVEIRLQKQSSSPEVEEHHQEGTEVIRGRSSDSNEGGYRVRSSSVEDFPDNDLGRKDYMEIDNEHKKDGASLSLSESDSENGDGSPGTPEPAGPPQRCFNMLQGCRSVDEFERLNKIDEGTYGVVYRAKDKKTGEIVALKKVKMEKEREGFPLTSLREINILLSFHHPSIVDVKEVVVGSNLDSIFMVMEYMEHDLKALMETMKQPFSQSEVKCLMLQLLEGTKYLHDNWVLHRDLKTSNLLLNNRGELKICDFGLARQYGSPLKPYTHLVVTLWYRAPELLLGAKEYSTAIDMWSLGCIMAELLSKQPLFNGKTEFDQLDKIFKTLGTPNETIWPGYSKLPGVKVNFVKHQYNLLRRKFPATSFTGSPVLSDAGFDLLNKLITYDPKKRITAEEALNHEWFREVPLPKSKDFMPTFPAQHAQDRRTRRVMKSPDPLEEQRRKELQQAEFGTGGLFG